MKCPKCGSSNEDAAEACANCGVRFRRKVTVKKHIVLNDVQVMKRRTLNRMVLLPLGISVAVAMAALLVAILFFSPWVSPLATVHDADGDGHPDAYDADPQDPEFWAEGSATIVVLVRSEHPYSAHNFTLLVNGAPVRTAEVLAGRTATSNVDVAFLIGITNVAQVVLGLTATDGSVAQTEMVLENGKVYEASFTIPYSA